MASQPRWRAFTQAESARLRLLHAPTQISACAALAAGSWLRTEQEKRLHPRVKTLKDAQTVRSTRRALHLPLPALGLSPTSVSTSDGEPLLLFAASAGRQMWRSSRFHPPEILRRACVKGAEFAINSCTLTVSVSLAINLSIKHLTGAAE